MVQILQLQYDTSKYQPLYDSIIDGNRKDDFINEYFDEETVEFRPKLINLNSEISNLILDTKKLMEQNKFKINEERFYVEFHKYNIQGQYQPMFDWHEDDNGAVNYNVCTCIYYLHKDENIIPLYPIGYKAKSESELIPIDIRWFCKNHLNNR